MTTSKPLFIRDFVFRLLHSPTHTELDRAECARASSAFWIDLRGLSTSTHRRCAHVLLSLETVFKDLRGSQAEIMSSTATGKGRTEVETAARAVHVFLNKESSHLRVFLSAVSDGGGFFVGNIHTRTACAAVRCRASDSGSGQAGIGAEQFIRTAVGRSCD